MHSLLAPKTIMVPLTTERPARLALRAAGQMARQLGSRLILAYVSPEPGHMEQVGFRVETIDEIRDRLEGALGDIIKEELGDLPHEAVARVDDPADGIVTLARMHGVDLIVLETRPRSLLERVFKPSVSAKVVQHAPCAVLVLPETTA
ncbi:universal stress protein [Immundisolibacter sp.]|uniref:universal stress protein n=1 Tax=Immundisolibacter sp. TaxID=1934948 RepID=UPI002625C8E7|nr:universal stress protein [Immundisolibacter sp.]MDD3650225.1 universal stress protein [Immundisolibacter sp.]